MNNINTGGPAFPSGLIDPSTPQDAVQPIYPGMTMRDYFAARASEEDIQRHLSGMVKVIVGQNEKGPIYEHQQAFRSREQARYRWADAMLEARSNT